MPDAARTDGDVAFLLRALPLPDFHRILDVPCGTGRHKDALSKLGYEVVGADVDPAVSPDIVIDLRRLDELPDDFDAAINMWASFGYFDAGENERILAALGRRVRSGGRVVLDLHNRDFFDGRAGERELRDGIVERSMLRGDRRRCEIHYGDGAVDVFDWQLYRPSELAALAAVHGLTAVLVEASPDAPTMRLVFERR